MAAKDNAFSVERLAESLWKQAQIVEGVAADLESVGQDVSDRANGVKTFMEEFFGHSSGVEEPVKELRSAASQMRLLSTRVASTDFVERMKESETE